MNETLIAVLGTLGGAAIGSILSPYLNHKYSLKKLEKEHEIKIDYMKQEIIFKRKTNYFEKISRNLEKIEDQLFITTAANKKEFLELIINCDPYVDEIINLKENDLYFKDYEIKKLLTKFLKIITEFMSIEDYREKERIKKISNKFNKIRLELMDYMQKELKL